MRVLVHDFVGLACKAGDKQHEVELAFHEIGLRDNLVFQWLHRRDNRVEVVVVVVARRARRMNTHLVFTVIVFIELFMLYLHNPRDILQVVFEFLIHELREILSRHLIFRVKLRLHFIQERFLDCVGAFLRGDMGDSFAAAARAAFFAYLGCLRHQILRRIHRKWKTIPVYITEIIPVAARDDCGDARITHPFATFAFIIQEFGFGFTYFFGLLSGFIRFDIFLYFNDRVVAVIYCAHSRPDHDCLRLLLRFIEHHFLILDEFIHQKHLEFGFAHLFLLVAVGFDKRIIGRVVFLIEINRNVAVIVFFDCVFVGVVLRENEAESLRASARAACAACLSRRASSSRRRLRRATDHRTRRPQFIALFA